MRIFLAFLFVGAVLLSYAPARVFASHDILLDKKLFEQQEAAKLKANQKEAPRTRTGTAAKQSALQDASIKKAKAAPSKERASSKQATGSSASDDSSGYEASVVFVKIKNSQLPPENLNNTLPQNKSLPVSNQQGKEQSQPSQPKPAEKPDVKPQKQEEKRIDPSYQELVDKLSKRVAEDKALADGVLPKLQENPSAPEFVEKLKRESGLADLYTKVAALQTQINVLESEIAKKFQNPASLDAQTLTKTLEAEKPFIAQRDDFLTQISAKQKSVADTVDAAKKEYDRNKLLHESYLERYARDKELLDSALKRSP